MGANSLKTKINDPAVRIKLVEDVNLLHAGSQILEEFTIAKGRARADLVVVSDTKVHAYEIKSDVDNLVRLPSQQKYYSSLFSTVTLVVGMDHAVKAMYMIPDWWGVMVALQSKDGDIELRMIRDPKENGNVSSISISEVMHKNEILKLLRQCAPGKNYSGLNKPKLVEEARFNIDANRIAKEFPKVIFARYSAQLA